MGVVAEGFVAGTTAPAKVNGTFLFDFLPTGIQDPELPGYLQGTAP